MLRHDVHMSAVYETLKQKTAGGAVVRVRGCEMYFTKTPLKVYISGEENVI